MPSIWLLILRTCCLPVVSTVDGAPASWTQGPAVAGPPKLCWTGASGYTADGAHPNSGALGTFEPNPDLRPEHLVALEAGVTARASRGSLQVVGFHHRLSDAVVRIRPPGQRYQRVNQEGVRSAGVEVLASRAVGVLELSADVTGQGVRVLDPAAGLTRPENMPEWMGGLRARMPLGGGLHAAVEARFTGEQFVIDPEHDAESRLAPAGRLDVELSRDWPVRGGGWFRGLQLRAAFDNLTDAVQFDAYGLPRPGRTMRLELRAY